MFITLNDETYQVFVPSALRLQKGFKSLSDFVKQREAMRVEG